MNSYKSYNCSSMSYELTCPVCESAEFYQEGEYVDIGVGYQKCSPDICGQCGYVESNGMKNQLPFEYYKQRWETGADPIPSPPCIRNGPIPEKYKKWIKRNVEHPYGKCQEYTRKMKQEFPNLQPVYGTYLDLSWGLRSHFFLYDPELDNLIIDPTVSQFPSGTGMYTIKYPVDIITLNRIDFKCNGWDCASALESLTIDE